MEQGLTLSKLTTEVATSKLQLALTRAEINIQDLINRESALVYNEDNIQKIADWLRDAKKAVDTIGSEHEKLKAPAWEECKRYDESKRNMLALFALNLNNATAKNDSICRDMAAKTKKEETEKLRKEGIQTGITNNILTFSNKIAACKTDEELVSVERLINLEKTRKEKYEEFAEEMILHLSALAPLVKQQKQAIRKLASLNDQENKAIESGDDERLVDIVTEKEIIEGQIQENKIKVQENSSNSMASRSYSPVSYVSKAAPAPKRRLWKWEVKSIELLQKKHPELVQLVVIKEKVDELLRQKREAGHFESIEELEIEGIRFYQDKKY